MHLKYIYPVNKKSGIEYQLYYRYKNRRLYLGTYKTFELASLAFLQAKDLTSSNLLIDSIAELTLPFNKAVSLINFRDNGVLFKNPIYVCGDYFKYYYSRDIVFLFDNKHLFFFSTNKIAIRGNYIYTQDGITQKNILHRFGIPSHSVAGKDYIFKNNNPYDFRKSNLHIINRYLGVTYTTKNGNPVYVAKIFLNKSIVVGHYTSEVEAAIAYNKAADLLEKHTQADYLRNEIPYLTKAEYNALYESISLSAYLNSPSINRRFSSTKKYRGICKDKSGYRASIGYKGKQIYLGIYPTEERAAQAYNFACFYLYNNNGYINDVTPLIYSKDELYIVKHLKKHNIIKG
jgi:hypothetical protein